MNSYFKEKFSLGLRVVHLNICALLLCVLEYDTSSFSE